MLQILGYGEDSLTLWALRHKMPSILQSLEDSASPEDCLALYRPSLGRHGGSGSAQFGEFDFILSTKENLYLGESKWDNLSKKNELSIVLKDIQRRRHDIFKWYVTKWLKHKPVDWDQFLECTKNDFNNFGSLGEPLKKLAPSGSILAGTLQGILSIIQAHIENPNSDSIRNVLLYFHKGNKTQLPDNINDFQIVGIDYSAHLKSGNLIEI